MPQRFDKNQNRQSPQALFRQPRTITYVHASQAYQESQDQSYARNISQTARDSYTQKRLSATESRFEK